MEKSIGDGENVLKRHTITAAEFDRMVGAGVFRREDRVELIDGELLDVPTQGPSHSGTIARLQHYFLAAFERRAQIRGQGLLAVGAHSQPQPDIAILRWNDSYYKAGHPTVDDTYAVVEVACTSLQFDSGVKRRIYGTARIPEYWIVDVQGKAIELCREPSGLGYASSLMARRDGSVWFAAFPDIVFTVDDLLGW